MAAEDDVTKVIHLFYDALEDILRCRGTGAMNALWHHGNYVTTSHPFGDWARGWGEVSATWEEAQHVFAMYKGHDGRSDGIGGISGLRVAVHGDAAYAASVYRSKLYMSDGEMDLKVNCTDIAHRIDGVWKLVHHHADQAPPDWQARLGGMVQRGRS